MHSCPVHMWAACLMPLVSPCLSGRVQTSGEIATAAVFAYTSLLFGKPLPPNTAICAECTATGVISGRPLDAEMVAAAKLNGIDNVVLARYDAAIPLYLWRACSCIDRVSI